MASISYIPHAVGSNVFREEYISITSSTCAETRTLFSIILRCFTTLFACTWTAIHPNIPGPNDSGLTVALRRLCIMISALAAPEFVLVWALHQLLEARATCRDFNKALQEGVIELRIKYGSEPQLVGHDAPLEAGEETISMDNNPAAGWYASLLAFYYKRSPKPSSPSPEYRRWTMKHSYFAWMGGFILFVNKRPYMREAYATLTPHELLDFIKADSVRVTMISEKEMDDRNKGDGLSKTVAFLQLSWFILQLAARAVGRLPTTQLEVDTLAICILGCFIHMSWWYKPKDVQCAVSVYWKGSSPPGETMYSRSKSIAQMVIACWDDPQEIPSLTLKLLKVTKLFGPFLDFLGSGTVSEDCVREHRVPTLGGYTPVLTWTGNGRLIWEWKRTLMIAVPAVPAGIVFVMVHLISWDSHFPSDVERLLWRVATSGMLAALLFTSAVGVYVVIFSPKTTGEVTKRDVWAAQAMALLGAVPYLLFRLLIVVLMLMSLRSVDPGVHDAICWTSLIPHL